ncbi:MAG: hypothetical protein VKJ06_06135 [Vampirovibrionales bacterium]|nr:hypothetical protein [Vampirovibrionales bacterium]
MSRVVLAGLLAGSFSPFIASFIALDAAACSGCAVSTTSAVAGAVTASNGASHDSDSSLIFNSMWSRTLWSMAVERDAESQRWQKKLGSIRGQTMLGFGAVSGLALAQSITSLSMSHPAHADVAAHDDHEAIEEHGVSKAPEIMGVVGSSLSVLTLGVGAVRGRSASKKLTQRLIALKKQSDEVVHQLKYHGQTDSVVMTLNELVGEEAAEEFLALWQAVGPKKMHTADDEAAHGPISLKSSQAEQRSSESG